MITVNRPSRSTMLAVASLAALVAVPAAAHAATLPSDEEALFVSAVDGSVYGLLEQVAVDAAAAELVELGAFPFDEEAAAQIRVTAVDHVAQTGDVIALVSGLISENYACILVTVDGETGEPTETPVFIGDGAGGLLEGLSAPCTALDVPAQDVFAQGFLPVTSDQLAAADEVGPVALVGTADGTLLTVAIETGLAFEPQSIEDGPETALEALVVVPFDTGDQILPILLLAYDGGLVYWLGGFEPDPQFTDLVPGRIVGLDLDASGRAWFTWIDESGDEVVTRVGAVEPTIQPSSASGEGDDAGATEVVPNVALLPASDIAYGAITLDGAAVEVEGITVVPAGFGEVGAGGDGGDELAATGTTPAAALVLGGLAVLLVLAGGVLLARRRSTA